MLYTSLEDNQFAGVGILLHSKHVKKSNRIHAFSGRVLALDICIDRVAIRVVAVYLPHCGYDVQVFDDTYEQIRCAIDQGKKKQRKIIVGGDFNTQANIGYRGMQLQSLTDSFGLCITNVLDIPWDLQWTFESMMGIRRKIDFILISRSFELLSGHASDEINLGSDHRAVKSVLKCRKPARKYRKSHPTLKNWTPIIGPSGCAEEFQAVL